MNKRYLFLGTILLASACATQKVKNLSFNLWEEPLEVQRIPASKLASDRSEVSMNKISTQLCGLTFDVVSTSSGHSSFYISQETFKHANLAFRYSLPGEVSVSKINQKSLEVTVSDTPVEITNPLFPQIPLLPLDKHPEICQEVKKYHAYFSKNLRQIISVSKTSVLNVSSRGAKVEISLRGDIPASLETAASRLEITDTKPARVSPSVIIYNDLYEKEVSDMAAVYRAAGNSMVLLPLSQLPGLDANGPVPAECEGERLRECYHVWGDAMEGVSQLSVPSLKGFFAQTTITTKYNKVSYIPGLIRAYIRSLNKVTPLKGVLLVGSDDLIAPFYSTMNRYGASDLYNKKLSTDIFYALPNPVIEPLARPHYEETSPWQWTCINNLTGVKTIRNWCVENEVRFWPEPPLGAYRFSSVTPHARVMRMKGVPETNQFMMYSFPNVKLTDIVPVGRLYTRNDRGGEKDPIVEEYASKILRWHRNLPSISNNSVASHGGADDYAFEKSEVDQFQQTFGTGSKIYASKHLLGGTKCSGRCEYVDGGDIMEGFGEQVNRSTYLFTAHGGAFGYQAPYPGMVPLKSSDTWSEGVRRAPVGDGLQSVLMTAPEYTTLKDMEDGTLFGTVLANACHINDFPFLENALHMYQTQTYQDNDQITVGQQFLQVPNGGSVNGFFNVDVGWAGSDSFYNAKFMQKMQIAHDSCGDVGEALRLTWFDMLTGKTNGAWGFHVVNRQLLGSPFNPMARKPASCNKIRANLEVINAL